MKSSLRYFLLIFLTPFICLFAVDPEDAFDDKSSEQDMDALRKWVRTKRLVTVKEVGGDLSISGEVRVESKITSEKKDVFGQLIQQRGSGSGSDVPFTDFDVKVSLMLDYRSSRTWSSTRIKYNNDMGQVSGQVNKIALDRAYLGGRIIDGDTFTLDLEIGRRKLDNVFDSKIEFSSLFDGFVLKFSKTWTSLGDFYVNAGPFIIDYYTYHFGYVGELGMLRIGNTGVFLKYSFIDWKKQYSNYLKNMRYRFGNSQVILGYQCVLPKWKKLSKIYASFLCNHFAEKIALTNYKKKNIAWYVGASIGQVKKAGDFAIDFNYQWVQAQTIPGFDVNGIKRGNAGGVGLYTIDVNGEGVATTRENAVGSCNYKGWKVECLYAITNNFTLLQQFQLSSSLDKTLGPMMYYKQYELELIYAF